MTILFLDFDGVLHPDAAYLVGKQPVLRAEGSLFMHAPLLVEALTCRPDVKIVLSTSWVPVLKFDRAKSFLPPVLQARVIGATWHSKGDFPREHWISLTRFYQISTYVERHHLRDWIAIDDDAEGWPSNLGFHLVHCRDSDKGISDPDTYAQLLWALTT